ncbi:hypothetical protein BIW11_02943 [Tropilaelaps mercedesae]|uniref:Uncharacterized protein n=1 Tax=Tropilaelaps mercedesae TaxID=418985 RepID=A0A1V9XUL5_9ACAR|nr:hypothetical protein BIW11_02943 [Tropilaelaps mercedesae]
MAFSVRLWQKAFLDSLQTQWGVALEAFMETQAWSHQE